MSEAETILKWLLYERLWAVDPDEDGYDLCSAASEHDDDDDCPSCGGHGYFFVDAEDFPPDERVACDTCGCTVPKD